MNDKNLGEWQPKEGETLKPAEHFLSLSPEVGQTPLSTAQDASTATLFSVSPPIDAGMIKVTPLYAGTIVAAGLSSVHLASRFLCRLIEDAGFGNT